ncbi:uncharacterized protein LOC117122939 [Anneissia japonica]|uniref:uncharacterized protein LOC117122939 n=1 Tax=Anneissia japonica TaxID=1529436 RepID=UPI0014257381|nr:uncharacterized protein LOC117122939 [Anneissia japonica]XP_033124610.1 uncharacterized protein LOC117122939 [Anneissia japonica]
MYIIMKAVVYFILLGCVYGAPADTIGDKSSSHTKNEVKTFNVDGQTLTETVEQTDDGTVIDVEAQEGCSGLTVFTDVTHGLLIHRYKDDDTNCYISSLEDYNRTRLAQENPSSVFKYILEPVSEIKRQYFINTATDSMKRVCGDTSIVWSEIYAVTDEQETRQKRDLCGAVCTLYCSIIYEVCFYSCRIICIE